MLSSNRGQSGDSWEKWDWFRQVRPRFGRWHRVELTYTSDPSAEKLVRLVDEQENTLELHGMSFGYEGGTPGEVVEMLVGEGFNRAKVSAVVFNSTGRVQYPQTIERSAGPLTLVR